jgi:AcrR family transcriptional regulator
MGETPGMTPRKYTLGKRTESVEETRRRIIDATFELHNEKGILATSMQDVAERADVALRTVYNHYPTVDDLVEGCGRKVIALLAPPTPAIFGGLNTFDERMRRLVRELFAMYERGSVQIEMARCEQGEVAGLADYVANEAALREALARDALRPFRPRPRTVQEVVALTDFYVWKSFTQQDLTTRQAADIIHRCLVALADPDALGKKGQ